MLAIGTMALLGVVAVVALLAVGLRRLTMDEAQTETWIASPETHAIRYTIPGGQDAAVLKVALAREGYTAVAEDEHGARHLLVAGGDGDREHIRQAIAAVHSTGFDGLDMMVADVVFDDERGPAGIS